MDIVFERGSREEAKGHALLYFRGSSNPEEIWATYLVILPITVDISKYVPPFLMSQVGDLGPKALSGFAFPPAPEQVVGLEYIQELAAVRGDDILFGGTMNPTDVPSAMMAVNEGVQWYAEIYSHLVADSQPPGAEADEEAAELGVNEVLYGLMSDSDKLSELTKLIGKLRFASEGAEEALIREAETDIHLLAKHLPEDHQVSRLIEAAKAVGSGSERLTALLLQRCFHMIQQEYVKLGQVEAEIKALESGGSGS